MCLAKCGLRGLRMSSVLSVYYVYTVCMLRILPAPLTDLRETLVRILLGLNITIPGLKWHPTTQPLTCAFFSKVSSIWRNLSSSAASSLSIFRFMSWGGDGEG